MPHETRLALVLAMAFALPASGFAAEYYAIVDDCDRKPLNAYLDVSVDQLVAGQPPDVRFEVYDSIGVLLADYIVPARSGFASTFGSGDLFDLANGEPLLVRAIAPSNAPTAGAALNLELRGIHMTIGVLQKLNFDGTPFGSGQVFSIPLGGFEKASVLIANVSHSDVGIESFSVAKGAPGSGTSLNERLPQNGIHKVSLTQNDAFTNFIVSSTGLVIVQLVIENGRTIQSYMVPPFN